MLNSASNDAESPQSALYRTIGMAPPSRTTQSSATSAADGNFCFSAVRPGQYTLVGSKPGFLATNYGAKSPAGSGTILNVGSTGIADLTLRLVPQSVISGKVVDKDGEPVIGCSIRALLRVWSRGRFINLVAAGAQTNDLGEYRVAGLPPGNYYVLAQPAPAAGDSVTIESPRIESAGTKPLRTFFPDSQRIAQASTIEIRTGMEAPGTNVTMQTGRTNHVRGKITGHLAPTDHGVIMLLPQDEEQLFIAAGDANLKPDGSFDFPDVAPGTYRLSFMVLSGKAAKAAAQSLEVGDQDVNDVALFVPEPAAIRGRIKMEGAPPEGGLRVQSSELHLVSADSLIGPSFAAKYGSDDSFAIDGVTPGKYFVSVKAPAGYFLKSVRMGSGDATGKVLDLSGGGGGELEIVYGRGLAGIDGAVQLASPAESAPSQNAKSAHIALVPTALLADGSGVLFASSQSTGEFSLANIPPGKYRAYAFASLDYLGMQNPSVLNALSSAGTEVELRENEQKKINLPLISVEDEESLLSRAGGSGQ